MGIDDYYESSNRVECLPPIIDEDQPFQSYSDKLACLKRSHIALWDVIKTCWRKGSKDKNICEPECNDIGKLLRKYPNIKKIVLNGKKAEEHFFVRNLLPYRYW